MALALVSFGICQASQAIASAGSEQSLPNITKFEFSDTADGFQEWLESGPANNTVYEGVLEGSGEHVYTGITKQPLSSRLAQHRYAGKNFKELQKIYNGLTRNQARAIETYLIQYGYANRLNKILSISTQHRYYADAMRWAAFYLGGL